MAATEIAAGWIDVVCRAGKLACLRARDIILDNDGSQDQAPQQNEAEMKQKDSEVQKKEAEAQKKEAALPIDGSVPNYFGVSKAGNGTFTCVARYKEDARVVHGFFNAEEAATAHDRLLAMMILADKSLFNFPNV